MASRHSFENHLKLDSLEGINHCNSNIKKLENIKSIQICDSIFDNEGCRSPTKKKLRRILLDGVASKSTSNLEEFSICGNMHIENVHDTRIISKAIANHSTTLKRVKIQDFIIHATDHEDSEPILESLIIAASSIETLKSLHIQCLAGYKQWNRAYLTSNALIPICQSHKLLGLNLSNLGLEDEHLITIGREIGSRSLNKNASNNIVLEELILNDNKNTSKGVEAMAKLLADNSSLQRLEVYNLHRINYSTCDIILENLKNKNHCIKNFHVNLPHAYQKDINFYLLLNRTGRNVVLDPNSTPNQSINVLAAANGDVSILMHFLKDNPTLCKSSGDNNSSSSDEDPKPASSSLSTSTEKAEAEKKQCRQQTSKGRFNNVHSTQSTDTVMRKQNNKEQESAQSNSDPPELIWRGFWYRK